MELFGNGVFPRCRRFRDLAVGQLIRFQRFFRLLQFLAVLRSIPAVRSSQPFFLRLGPNLLHLSILRRVLPPQYHRLGVGFPVFLRRISPQILHLADQPLIVLRLHGRQLHLTLLLGQGVHPILIRGQRPQPGVVVFLKLRQLLFAGVLAYFCRFRVGFTRRPDPRLFGYLLVGKRNSLFDQAVIRGYFTVYCFQLRYFARGGSAINGRVSLIL